MGCSCIFAVFDFIGEVQCAWASICECNQLVEWMNGLLAAATLRRLGCKGAAHTFVGHHIWFQKCSTSSRLSLPLNTSTSTAPPARWLYPSTGGEQRLLYLRPRPHSQTGREPRDTCWLGSWRASGEGEPASRGRVATAALRCAIEKRIAACTCQAPPAPFLLHPLKHAPPLTCCTCSLCKPPCLPPQCSHPAP